MKLLARTAVTARKFFSVMLLGMLALYLPVKASAEVCNIKQFLDACPTSDPALDIIRNDFTIRKDGVIVNPVCPKPISQLTTAQYTDELIVLQALRTIYYLDLGQSGHLPWTSGTLYDWLKQKINGINITTTGPDQCCSNSFGDGKMYFNVRAKNDVTRDWQRGWIGMSELIGLLMHERRHLDGTGFPHLCAPCAAGAGACDQQYDETNLSPYGIQWWLRKKWVEGGLYTGYSCLGTKEVADIKNFLRGMDNSERNRYCTNPPPLLTDANNPVEHCRLLCGKASMRDWMVSWLWLPPWVPIILAVVAVVAVLVYRRSRSMRR